MQTTIDAAGRIVVPKPLRDAMGLTAGQRVDVVFVNGRIEIELAPAEVVISREGRLPRLLDRSELPELSDEDVRAALDAVRR